VSRMLEDNRIELMDEFMLKKDFKQKKDLGL
jgi:hypothetical protein